ncbi:alpha/beta hydrolase [Haloechinothrix sp. LS1_15]|uniref:alpha/beta fold hydrolase n=1 Tax=Haloechinothrix sp. LS1_15 TaxID=2652248 RepID=UPI002946E5E6|nr:alpha/beta hydrolase [Haloechinothrix sp. LS1_15]MDV6012374.1 alpha/beta hydrolase [Haloechinothrix sp. LS1_15]
MRAQVSGTVDRADGARLRWWRVGRGEPILLVHGSFDDHLSWSPLLSQLASRADVTSYDRRGHSASTAPRGQGSIRADADDLLAVLDTVIGGPAHLVGHSYGGSVALLAAAMRRDAVRSLAVYEPPLYGLLDHNPVAKVFGAETGVWMSHAAELIRAGNPAQGARIFAEKVGFGKGSWDGLFTREQRMTMVSNAHTWLDQYNDPTGRSVDIATLAWARFPITLLTGERTFELNRMVTAELAERLPLARSVTIPGAGHAGHLTHPVEFASALF